MILVVSILLFVALMYGALFVYRSGDGTREMTAVAGIYAFMAITILVWGIAKWQSSTPKAQSQSTVLSAP